MRLNKKYKNKNEKIPLNKYLNKIGYCNNKHLDGLKGLSGGHYVYISSINRNGTFNVKTITSLESKNYKIYNHKMKNVKKGKIYPIPKKDSNFSQWSGVNNRIIRNVEPINIKDIGRRQIKRKHLFYLGKFMK